MAAVYEGRAMRAQRIGGPLERLIYRGAGVDSARDMGWVEYAMAMLWFNLAGGLFCYARAAAADMAAAQSAGHGRGDARFRLQHGDELHHEHELAGLRRRVDDELSHADARPRRAELRLRGDRAWPCWSRSIRGFARKEATGIGNFWVDLVRSTVYILLPLAVILTVALVSQGVPQTFNKYVDGDARAAGDLRQSEERARTASR